MQVQGKKAIEIKHADVAELVDARDLKSPGATEITHLSDLTRAGNPHEAGGDPAILSNTLPPLRASWKALEDVGQTLARTGLMIKGRDGLSELIDEISSGRADFDDVLVYGVSRCVVLCDRRPRANFRYALFSTELASRCNMS